MREIQTKGHGLFIRFNRAYLVSSLTILLWTGFASGLMSLSWGNVEGWLGICVGALAVAIPLSRPFRRLWTAGNAAPAYHALVFLGGFVLVLMFGMMAMLFVRDQSYVYSERDRQSLILWGVAAVLSGCGLLAGTIAYVLDRGASAQL